jgi:hypothetical protein
MYETMTGTKVLQNDGDVVQLTLYKMSISKVECASVMVERKPTSRIHGSSSGISSPHPITCASHRNNQMSHSDATLYAARMNLSEVTESPF